MLLAGCAGELNTPGEALRLLGGSLPDGHPGEPYEESLRTAGGLRPYTFELSSGELPPGLELDNGVIRGTPTAVGSWTFTVTLSDANLSSTFLEHRLRVSELPPPSLDLVMPRTETRAPFTVRVGVKDARELLGLSSRLRWDPARFSYVEGSLNSASDGYALFADSGSGWLQVDLAWLGSSYSGERQLFSFQLTPLEPARPGIDTVTDFALATAAGSSFQTLNSGARVPPLRSAPAEPAAAEPEAEQQADESASSEPEPQPTEDAETGEQP